MHGWKKLLDSSNNIINNYNLVPIHILQKQKELIESNNSNDILLIRDAMKHLAKLGETYFEANKFTDMNKFLRFIDDLLNYLTKMVIGNGIEMIMRRILLTFYSNSDPNINLDDVTSRIDFILNEKRIGMTKSLLEILYDDICPLLVKNSAEIYENKADEMGHNVQPVREILTNYFQLLDLAPNLTDQIRNVFKSEVVNYFDTFISRTILLWYVNVENILKFHINNYRCLETYIVLNHLE